MEVILTQKQSEALNLQPFWEAVYPNWPVVKAKLLKANYMDPIPHDEAQVISDTMARLMAEWGLRLPAADDPNIDKYDGFVFVDEDAYHWFMQNWQ